MLVTMFMTVLMTVLMLMMFVLMLFPVFMMAMFTMLAHTIFPPFIRAFWHYAATYCLLPNLFLIHTNAPSPSR